MHLCVVDEEIWRRDREDEHTWNDINILNIAAVVYTFAFKSVSISTHTTDAYDMWLLIEFVFHTCRQTTKKEEEEKKRLTYESAMTIMAMKSRQLAVGHALEKRKKKTKNGK